MAFHFEKLEERKGLIVTAMDLFRAFVSFVRTANLNEISIMNEIFPDEYDSRVA